MKIDNIPDPHEDFKRIFVKVVDDYVKDPTDKKQAQLLKFVTESIQLDATLLAWFNVMFNWNNTQFGLDVKFKDNFKFPS